MNEHDSQRLARQLEADGMEATDDVEQADVVLLNTCCIRENADNKLYGHLGHLRAEKDRRPDLQIAVAGCLAQKDAGLVREKAPHVDVVLGTHNVGRAAELLHHAQEHGPIVEILDQPAPEDGDAFPSALPMRDLPHAAWVTIQIGCDNKCAFCIVPAVRGKEISRPFDELVHEVEALAVDGVTEVTLLGQNVNSYGRDITRRRPLFADLLRAVGDVDGIKRVRFTSPHPKDLRPDTIAAMADTPAVCEHLHLPLQSGSDRVLAAMHRGYTATRYRVPPRRKSRSRPPHPTISPANSSTCEHVRAAGPASPWWRSDQEASRPRRAHGVGQVDPRPRGRQGPARRRDRLRRLHAGV